MESFHTLGTFLLIIFTITSTPIQGDRILFFLPLSSKSMANLFEPLALTLSNRGHELTIVAPIKFKINSENVTQAQWFTPEELYKDYPDPFDIRRANNIFRFPIPFLQNYCHKIFQKKEFQKITNQSFDLIVVNLIHHDCFAGAFYKIGAPIIFMASVPAPSRYTELFGNTLPSSFLPIVVMGDVSEQLNFIQRTKNFLYNAYFTYHLEVQVRPALEEVYRKYLGQNVPSIAEIYRKQASLILQNSHYTVTYPRPLLPTIVEIGGIHCKDPQPLPKDLEDFVNGTKDGFVVFSLGSIVRASSMPESVRLAFLKTFSKLKQRVIWKWELEGGMPDAPPNVKIVKWLPQQDLLGHPNIRLFITHGGLLSTEESVYHGVPILGFPIFVDQDANMKLADELGFGIKGEILNLTQAKLEPLVTRILDEPMYSQKAKNLSRIFRDQPHSSLDKAVFWTEYVLRHEGAYHLRSAGRNLNMLQYHCIDIVVFLATLLVSLILFLYYSVKLVIAVVSRGIYYVIRSKVAVYKKKNM